MRQRAGQTPTPAIIVASIFALMFIGTVTFFVYQFQKGSSTKKNANTNTTKVNKNANKNKNTNTATNRNANTNTSTGLDLSPLSIIPNDWKYYTSPLITYTVRYPATWSLEEVSIANHPVQKIPVRYIRLSNPTGQVALTLGIRRVGDTFGIGERTTTPIGTLQNGTPFLIGATTVTPISLVVDGKVPAIFYYPVKPVGFTYIEGREVQAEVDLTQIPGAPTGVTNLLESTETQIANTILSTLTFADTNHPIAPPNTPAAPLGQYKVESYRSTPSAPPDTRLINLDGGIRTVVINSTRTQAGLAANHGLMMLAFPSVGTTLYLQDQLLKSGSPGGAIWTYNTKTKHLTKQASYPPVGYGKFVINKNRTRAIYTSSVTTDDSGDITTLYYLDLVQNTISSLVTLRDNQTFSAGWGGNANSFSFSFKTDGVVLYSFYDQNSGNKQSKAAKTKLGDGQVVVPGANAATQ